MGDEFDFEATVEHIENPRDEDETHEMETKNERYAEVIGGQGQDFEDGMYDIFETLTAYAETIEGHEDRFLPDVLGD